MTISRVRLDPGGTDQYGDPTAGTETATAIPDAFVAPRMSNDIEGRAHTGVIVGLTLYAPYSFDIAADDLVDVDGVRYRIDGEVGKWRSPFTGWEAGQTVDLVRAES